MRAFNVSYIASFVYAGLSTPISSLKRGRVHPVVSVFRKLVIVSLNSVSAVSSMTIQPLMNIFVISWKVPPRSAIPLRIVLTIPRSVYFVSISNIRIFTHSVLRDFLLSLIFLLFSVMVADFMGYALPG
jgi:hypothetical protein